MTSKLSHRNKLTAFFAVFFAVCLLLSGCGGSSEQSADSSAAKESADGTDEETLQEEQAADEIVFEQMTVADNDVCSIVITGIDDDYVLSVELENKSEDTTYMFSISAAAVNGVEADPLYAQEVSAGNKATGSIDFSWDSTLEENGIDVFTDIELTFYVYDSDDWLADPVVNDTVNIYPYGEEYASVFERESLDSDIVLVDNDYVTVIVTGFEEDSIWGYTVNLFLVNKTETEAIFSVDEAAVNGYMCDPLWAKTLSSGKCAFSSIYWYESELEDIGITDYSEIEEIEFLLTAYDYNDWLSDYWVQETITLNP